MSEQATIREHLEAMRELVLQSGVRAEFLVHKAKTNETRNTAKALVILGGEMAEHAVAALALMDEAWRRTYWKRGVGDVHEACVLDPVPGSSLPGAPTTKETT